MDPRSLHILEYDKVIERLAAKAQTRPGEKICRELVPQTDLETATTAQSETDDATRWLLKRDPLPFAGIDDITAPVQHAAHGATLSCAALLGIGRFLRAVGRIHKRKPKPEDGIAAHVEKRLNQLMPLPTLSQALDVAIAGEDELHDAASAKLSSLRRQIRRQQEKVKETLDRVIKSRGHILQDQLVTLRSDRYVVPLKAEHRGALPGIVHDTSSSGATLFVEPMPVVDLNNRIRELRRQEEEECQRILRELSEAVAEQEAILLENLAVAAQLDFILAKGQLALSMRAMPPQLNTKGKIVLREARHPLIAEDQVVPIDFELGTRFQTLVITGPNTGGKTVSLKTCGLLCLMAMAGLQIPAKENSQVSVFDQILADIGDEQSIEQSLSTFSSHMRNIVSIADQAGPGMLVLVDELGSGTDPSEGAALAMAILDHLRQRGCQTVATTHYKELKAYALHTEGVENACCEFDTETLQPTYRLLIGIPGVSNAFVISRRLGLDESIIEMAKQFLSEEGIRFEELIASVEAQNRKTRQLQEEAATLRREAAAAKEEWETRQESLAQRKRKILQQAREEARLEFREAQEEVDELLKELRQRRKDGRYAEESMADRTRQKIGRHLSHVESSIGKETLQAEKGPLGPDSIEVGMSVQAPSLGLHGKVIEGCDNRGQCLLQSDEGIRVRVPVTALHLAQANEKNRPRSQPQARPQTSKKDASTEIKLLGQTVEEALQSLDKFLDDAVMTGIRSVRIVHGKGTGALRQAVQQALRKDSRVSEFRLGSFGEGDSGVTLAKLK